MQASTMNILTALQHNSVIPVMTVESAEDALTTSRQLVEVGYTALEVTLRTAEALAGIQAMKSEFPNLIIGAGTIVTPNNMDDAIKAGADFLVTPATTLSMARVLIKSSVPVVPGCATASEAQTLYEMGFEILKFFPAKSNGGIKALKSIAAPLPHLKFMATGGISENTAPDYLKLNNVLAVGGSWMTK